MTFPRKTKAEKRKEARLKEIANHNKQTGIVVTRTETGLKVTNYNNAAENRKNLGCTTGRHARAV